MNYLEYMQSDQWRTKRKYAIHKAGYKCDICRSKLCLEVHHKTYENLGNEKDEELQVLCKRCHKDLHYQKNKARASKDMILQATPITEKEYRCAECREVK